MYVAYLPTLLKLNNIYKSSQSNINITGKTTSSNITKNMTKRLY